MAVDDYPSIGIATIIYRDPRLAVGR